MVKEMPCEVGNRGPAKVRGGRPAAGAAPRAQRLVRDSRIFAAAIREILDVKLLREVSPEPLTPSQFRLLKLMSLDGRHQIGEVAGFLGVSPPAATKNVDKLERLGLITRGPSKGDRRATLLSVSPKGRRLVRRYEQRQSDCLAPVFKRFRRAEIVQFTELLERFSVSLLESEPAPDGNCLRCAGYIVGDCPVGHIRGGCRYSEIRSRRPSAGHAERV